MKPRKVHAHEKGLTAIAVGVSFTVKFTSTTAVTKTARSMKALVELATHRTCEHHPILTSIIRADSVKDSGDDSSVEYFCTNPRGLEVHVANALKFWEEPFNLPDTCLIQKRLTEEARQVVDTSKSLFSLTATKYIDEYLVCYLVISHAITDGTSIFNIIDTFCHFLSDEVVEVAAVSAKKGHTELYFPVEVDRDLVEELLSDPRCTAEPDIRFAENSASMLKLPPLTKATCDHIHNGYMKVIFREFEAEITARILHNCREHKVTFQALLSAVSSLALLKGLHYSQHSTEKRNQKLRWDAPVFQFCPVNLRRFLKIAVNTSGIGPNGNTAPSNDSGKISANCSGGVWWKQSPFESFDKLSDRLFWSDLVRHDTYEQICACLESSYPLQYLQRGSAGQPCNPYTLAACSIGNISIVKQRYGTSVFVHDINMQVGIYAPNHESYLNPTVPEAMLTGDTPAHLMLHAYTVFGRLKISGEYYAYSDEFSTLFYEEIVRLLLLAGSDQCAGEGVRVGDLLPSLDF